MSKKINKQLIFNIISIASLLLSAIALIGVVNNANWHSHLTMRETYSDLIVRTKIECLKNPSESCEKEVERVQKQLDDFIRQEFKK